MWRTVMGILPVLWKEGKVIYFSSLECERHKYRKGGTEGKTKGKRGNIREWEKERRTGGNIHVHVQCMCVV